jgi:gas vesicle protein
MFGTALGLALAFGLGGREVASKMVGDAFQKGQEKSGAVRRDLETGKERGQQDAERAKQRAQQEHAQRSDQDEAPGQAGARPAQGQAPRRY